MHSMSPDDAEYSQLLAQLLSGSPTSRNARVHSWIEHQYDFVLSENPSSSRPASPSPSSSLGAYRNHSIDRPDSPLLPRFSSERPSSPCPSYDALFFPTPHSKSDDNEFEEQERVRALRFIVQEMAHWKSHANASPRLSSDKPLPAPPPSPASSTMTQSTSSRAMRSRSSSTRISRLPSFTSTLSSDQSSPQELPPPPPLPVSVIVHGEFQHDLVLSRDCPLIDGYLHKRDDSFAHSLLYQEQDGQLLCTVPDDLDSALQPSPTLSSFSCAHSRDTSVTTPYASEATSPMSAVFCPSQCSPENIALPLSPVDDAPNATRFPVSPPSPEAYNGVPQSLCAPKLERSQSRWSIATTASMAPSNSDAKSSILLNMRLSPHDRREKALKTPNKKRTRFISLISRFSPGRNDPALSTSTVATDDIECDSLDDSDGDDKDKKPRKSLSKKSSLASIRASFSISRASFNSQRPPLSSSIDEIPPLPTSPTSPTRPSLAEAAGSVEIVSPPRPSLSKIPSRANVVNTALPPIPQSASTVSSFHSSSCVSISDASAESPPSRSTTANVSRVSLLPAPSKRTSLASAAGIEPMAPANPTTNQTTTRPKSIFRLAPRPKSIKVPPPGTKASVPPKLPHTTSLPSPTTVRSRIPHAPAKFNPPTKLAMVIATQTRPSPALANPGPAGSKLPQPPSRIQPKVARPAVERLPVEHLAPSSRLPTASKAGRVATVKGFWKRQ